MYTPGEVKREKKSSLKMQAGLLLWSEHLNAQTCLLGFISCSFCKIEFMLNMFVHVCVRVCVCVCER